MHGSATLVRPTGESVGAVLDRARHLGGEPAMDSA